MKLEAPKDYWSLSDEEKSEIVNKCGPSGLLRYFVPNQLLGLDISESCNIHDFMFDKANNQDDAKVADKVFLDNMKAQINAKSRGFVATMRRFMAYLYYIAVRGYSRIYK